MRQGGKIDQGLQELPAIDRAQTGADEGIEKVLREVAHRFGDS